MSTGVSWEFISVGAVVVAIAAYLLMPKKEEELPPAPAPKAGKSSADKEKEKEPEAPGGPLLVYFASQTGTAESFAKTMQDQGRAAGFAAQVVDLEDFEADQLHNARAAIFLIATYGEGEPTDNSVGFTRWLTNKDGEVEANFLNGLHYAVFGLGNRQYEHFNAMGVKVDAGLAAFGATQLLECGVGDDDGSLEDDFEAWRERCWPVFTARFMGGRARSPSMDAQLPDFAFKSQHVSTPQDAAAAEALESAAMAADLRSVATSSHHFYQNHDLKVVTHRELRQDTRSGSTVHVEVELQATAGGGAQPQYLMADNLAVLPENEACVVEAACAALRYDPDRWFRLVPTEEGGKAKALFPTPCSVRTALARYVDLTGAPRKSLLATLALFAQDGAERERLTRLGGKEGREEYAQWVTAESRSLLEVLQSFPSLEIPLEHFIELTPRLQPRYYTIASSPLKHPKRIHLTVSVIHERKRGGDGERWLDGVCSSHLARLQPPVDASGRRTDHVERRPAGGVSRPWPTARVFVRPSSFRLPADTSVPVVMVGPGTGIAPMRAVLQHRQAQREEGCVVGPTVLFFGCRHREQDFIYENELLGYGADGTLTQLHTAFSREQDTKVYVQHRLAEQGGEVFAMLQQGAYFFVCGGTGMGHDVMKTVVDIIREHKCVNAEAASAEVKELQAAGRYVQELWSA